MAERIKLQKKTRFEVFKRDSFTCQYCGRSSPSVILEVDHIVPVAEGGTNDLMNLITSCRDCNRGKGKRMLSDESAVERQRKQLETAALMKEQTDMMIKWRAELLLVELEQLQFISDVLLTVGIELTEYGQSVIKKNLKEFGFPEVCEAIDISIDKYLDQSNPKTHEIVIKRIGGICYNRKNGLKGGHK